MKRRTGAWTRRWAGLALLAGLAAQAPSAADRPEWVDVRYDELVDARAISHSGESLGALLRGLGGRPLPPPGERPQDRLAHSLIDPLIEPYAFVLSDLLDRERGADERPWIEVGRLWSPGEAQPAWVELLRARALIAETDGAGRMRVLLPLPPGSDDPDESGAEVARREYGRWWPVLRLVFAAERRRLGADGGGTSPTLDVEVHAFVHQPERVTFRLGLRPWTTRVDDTRPSGDRPPLDLDAIRAFLDAGLRLEGGRLDEDGRLTLLGSRVEQAPTLLGRPVALADLAVAYRAVRHGGLAEPYMSLDRGASPQTAVVNYGGRLRDTALGWVSLLCDIRFKTFSLGLDIVDGGDRREEIRRRIPGFRSHLERFAADPSSRGVLGQQTRLWFYPDAVDLTVSQPGDLLAMRRVRMSAASERVSGGTMTASGAEDPPWTRATVAAINEDYDALAGFFPEMTDLDQVVRMLSLFTWLRQAESRGLPVPDLDALLDVELPATSTPRTFPQLLAFNALPPAGTGGDVAVIERLDVGAALDRLSPAGAGRLEAADRLLRAVAALDPEDAQHAALLAEFRGYDRSSLDAAALDLMAFRAERLRMHGLVLSTLDRRQAAPLAERQRSGEDLRIFSVGIGGLDLGMGQVLDRSTSSSLSLTGLAPATTRTEATVSSAGEGRGSAREAWRGEARDAGSVRPGLVDARVRSAGRGERLYDADGSEPTRVVIERNEDGTVARFDRYEDGLRRVYRFEPEGASSWVARRLAPAEARGSDEALSVPPAGLVRLALTGGTEAGSGAPSGVRLEALADGVPRKLEADIPRAVLERLVLGRSLDADPGAPMPLTPPPPSLGRAEALLVIAGDAAERSPWDVSGGATPGERTPVRIARALTEWSRSELDGRPQMPAVVGTAGAASEARWVRAPRVGPGALLCVPSGALDPIRPGGDASLREAWGDGPVAQALPTGELPWLVVLVSDEPPSVLARRLRDWARDPALAGRLVAVWSLAGPLRPDLPGALLEEGLLAGIGVADASWLSRREVASSLSQLAQAVENPLDAGTRVERLPGPFLWFY